MVTAREAKKLAARREALGALLAGKAEANSATLSASYGLPIAEVLTLMRRKGVRDNG